MTKGSNTPTCPSNKCLISLFLEILLISGAIIHGQNTCFHCHRKNNCPLSPPPVRLCKHQNTVTITQLTQPNEVRYKPYAQEIHLDVTNCGAKISQ